MSSINILKSYVWHDGQCYFVSTIERDSSDSFLSRFNETMVWEYDWDKGERGRAVFEDSTHLGNIHKHQFIVEALHVGGLKWLLSEHEEP